MDMRIWVIQAGETGEGMEIAYDGEGDARRDLVFADTAEGYAQAVAAFKALVDQRIGKAKALYSFGEFGTDARTAITATDHGGCYDEQCDCYPVDIVKLVDFKVIGA